MTATVTGSAQRFSLLDALVAFIRRRLDAHESPVSARPLPADAQAMADTLLGASDLADLKDRAGDAAFLPLAMSQADVEHTIEKLDALHDVDLADAGLANVFGEGPCAAATTGFRMLISMLKLMRAVGAFDRMGEVPVPQPKEIAALAYDVNVPSRYRMALWRMALATPASCAMLRAVERGNRVEPWLAKAIADMFTDGIVAMGALASELSEGESSVGKDAVRHHELVTRWAAEARASGLDVYFPFGDPDAVAG